MSLKKTPYILILYYSKNGSVAHIAQQIARGVNQISSIEAQIRTVPPVSATCEATQAPIPTEGPPYVTHEDIRNCSGIILGSPAYFGQMAAPLKYCLDSLTNIWFEGALLNKPAAVFTSSTSLHGGQESTLLSMMLPLFHQGAIVLGLPYTEKVLSTTQTGGTPYGPTHVSGPNHSTTLSVEETHLCQALGKRVASIALQLI